MPWRQLARGVRGAVPPVQRLSTSSCGCVLHVSGARGLCNFFASPLCGACCRRRHQTCCRKMCSIRVPHACMNIGKGFPAAGGGERNDWNTMDGCFMKQWTDMLQRLSSGSVCCIVQRAPRRVWVRMCGRSHPCNGHKALMLVGDFAPRQRSRARSLEPLWRSSRDIRGSILRGLGPSGDGELNDELTMTTKDECDRGWLVGPFTETELDCRLGLWLPAGIRQGHEGGVRVIDDYSVASHNGATSVSEKVDVGGVADVVGISRCLLSAKPSSVFWVPLSNGQWCRRRVHPEWEQQDLQVKGRVWDLSKVFRQLARNLAHASFTVVATWNNKDKHKALYKQPVLAFGAWASVPHFCWVVRASWHVLNVLGSVPWTHYVDDHPTFMFNRLCGSLKNFVEGFFSVIGFKFKEQPSFSDVFCGLGVDFAFPFDRSVVVVSSRETRRTAISKTVQEAEQQKRLTRHARTVSSWANHQRPCAAVREVHLGAVADRSGDAAEDVELAIRSLSDLVRLLQAGTPREVPAIFPSPWLTQTGGACEETSSTFSGISTGTVLFSPTGSAHFFGTEVLRVFMNEIGLRHQMQVVGQAELLALVVSRYPWE